MRLFSLAKWCHGFSGRVVLAVIVAPRHRLPRSMIQTSLYVKTGLVVLVTVKLTRKQVSIALKDAAVKLGLKPKFFSSHCLKIGALSEMSVQGEGMDVIRRLGDHSKNSSSTFLYQHSLGRETRPLLLASSDKGITVKDINLICPITHVPYVELAESSEINGSLVKLEDNPDYVKDFDRGSELQGPI